jgi:hypothetical protein
MAFSPRAAAKFMKRLGTTLRQTKCEKVENPPPLPIIFRHVSRKNMREYTLKEKTKITAGAVAALVIVAWLAIIALALLSGR